MTPADAGRTDAGEDPRPVASILALNETTAKPRTIGFTEVRGPYYSIVGPGYLEDLLAVAGDWIDSLKIPAPGVALLHRDVIARMIDLCHRHDVVVSAGGLIERVAPLGTSAIDRYFDAVASLGFDAVEVSAGMLSMATPDYLRLVERASATGMTVKAEVGVQFGAGGTSTPGALEAEGTMPASAAVHRARRALDAGADIIVLESEGVTESVTHWRTDVPGLLAEEIGLEKLLFEAADPAVFEWYVKHFGPDVNLFIDHSQALHLASLRTGVWSTSSLWGRVVSYRPPTNERNES